MAQSYAEYLKANGATEDEVKILDTPIARRAYEKMQADLAESARVAALAKTDLDNYNNWFQNDATPAVEKANREAALAKANEARAKELIKTLAAQDEGMAEIARGMGFDVATGTSTSGNNNGGGGNANPGGSNFDPNRYFTRDEILQVAEKEGEAIAIAQDIAYEHRVLFPDKPLNFRELRREARDAKKPVEQLWMEKYNVSAARQKRDDDTKAAEIAKWKAEGAKEKEAELVSRFANPETRPLAPSNSPFIPRPERGRDKQPWETGDRSADRVANATQKLVKSIAAPVN